MMSIFGAARQAGKPYAFHEGVAFISVSGVLLHRFSGSWGFATGYDALRSQIAHALSDSDVKRVVLDVDSPGGECAGCFELSDWLYSQRGAKPIDAVVDASAYSAAYAIASAADTISVTPTGGAGSIGVIGVHREISAAMEKAGVSDTLIYAGARKADGHPSAPLTPEARKNMQDKVDALYSLFVSTVARNRGLSEGFVRSTEAAVFSAAEAQKNGLVDAVASPQDFMAALRNAENLPEEETPMAEQTPVVVSAEQETGEQVKAAVAAERARIHAIQSLPEATGRETLAAHFALQTDLPVEQAQAALAAAPTASVIEAVATGNAFDKAMQASGNPQVGAEDTTGQGEDDPVKACLLAYQAATNTPLKI
jgi:signal peptide peptidase SppA